MTTLVNGILAVVVAIEEAFLRGAFKLGRSDPNIIVEDGAELLRFLHIQAGLALEPIAMGATALAMLEADSAPGLAEVSASHGPVHQAERAGE